MHRTILPRHQIPALLMMMIFSTFVQQSRALSSAAPPVSKSYDLVVIGGGSAGLTAAKFAATFKKSVVIIEESRLGGDCTWSGCVPSKALIASAKAAHTARTSESYGVSTGRVKVDMKAIRDRMARIQQRIYEKDDSPEAMKKLGIETLSGRATFQSPSTLDVAGETPQRIEARLGVIVATGASPKKPTDKIDGLEKVEYFTYEDIFGLETLPETMTIVGGGPIGCELAQTYARLGVKVTQVATKLLMREEPEVCKVMEEAFAEDGVERIKGRMVRVESAKRGTAHKGSCKLEDGSEVVITGDLLLVAAGRSPNVKGFGLEELGVKFNDKGGIETDDMLQSSVNRVYAAGDCTGGKQFTHLAGYQGAIAARNILLPLSDPGVLQNVPSATFTSPEVSSIGLTETQAKQDYGENTIGVAFQCLNDIDRALCDGSEKGFIKIVYHSKNHQILGATVMAPGAGELISEVAVAIKSKLPFDQLSTVVHSYPAYSIALQMMASEVYYEKLVRFKPVLDFLKRIGL